MDYKDPDKLIDAIIGDLYELKIIAVRRATLFAERKIKQEFKAEKEATGKRWKPLKDKTVKEKLREGFSEKILHRTTTLKQSFFSYVHEGKNPVGIVATPVKYAIFHEEGTKHIPKRPFIAPVVEVLEDKFPEIAAESFNEAFKE